MKKVIKAASVFAFISMLSGCIIAPHHGGGHHGGGRGYHGGNYGGYHGGNHGGYYHR
jgi:hypothetical protein